MDKIDWLLINALNTHKSMAKAAEALFLSQPAVSYRMNRMEQEFRQTLFSRSNRGIRLTSAGLRLQSFSALMLQYDDFIFNQVHQEASTLTGLITLGTTSNFLIHHLNRQLKQFSSLYPGIRLQLRTDSSTALFEKMQSRELMMTVIRGRHGWDGPSIKIFDEPLILIASEPITDELLHTAPLLLNSIHSPDREPIDQWIAEYFGDTSPVSSPIQFYGDSIGLKSLVCQGFGWAVITSSRLEPEDHLYYKLLLDKNGNAFHYKTYLIYSEECNIFDTYRAYIAHLTDYFSSIPSPPPDAIPTEL